MSSSPQAPCQDSCSQHLSSWSKGRQTKRPFLEPPGSILPASISCNIYYLEICSAYGLYWFPSEPYRPFGFPVYDMIEHAERGSQKKEKTHVEETNKPPLGRLGIRPRRGGGRPSVGERGQHDDIREHHPRHVCSATKRRSGKKEGKGTPCVHPDPNQRGFPVRREAQGHRKRFFDLARRSRRLESNQHYFFFVQPKNNQHYLFKKEKEGEGGEAKK